MSTGTKPGWYPGRCKDCASEDLVGARCATCRAAHNERESKRRKARRKAGTCTVCGSPAAVVGGEPLTVCKVHREYYRRRDAAARAGS